MAECEDCGESREDVELSESAFDQCFDRRWLGLKARWSSLFRQSRRHHGARKMDGGRFWKYIHLGLLRFQLQVNNDFDILILKNVYLEME